MKCEYITKKNYSISNFILQYCYKPSYCTFLAVGFPVCWMSADKNDSDWLSPSSKNKVWNNNSTTQKAGLIKREVQKSAADAGGGRERDERGRLLWKRSAKKSLEYAGRLIKHEIWRNSFKRRIKITFILSSCLLWSQEPKQAEEEGNWMIWSTFQKTPESQHTELNMMHPSRHDGPARTAPVRVQSSMLAHSSIRQMINIQCVSIKRWFIICFYHFYSRSDLCLALWLATRGDICC